MSKREICCQENKMDTKEHLVNIQQSIFAFLHKFKHALTHSVLDSDKALCEELHSTIPTVITEALELGMPEDVACILELKAARLKLRTIMMGIEMHEAEQRLGDPLGLLFPNKKETITSEDGSVLATRLFKTVKLPNGQVAIQATIQRDGQLTVDHQ
jgi:hypothetical protein